MQQRTEGPQTTALSAQRSLRSNSAAQTDAVHFRPEPKSHELFAAAGGPAWLLLTATATDTTAVDHAPCLTPRLRPRCHCRHRAPSLPRPPRRRGARHEHGRRPALRARPDTHDTQKRQWERQWGAGSRHDLRCRSMVASPGLANAWQICRGTDEKQRPALTDRLWPGQREAVCVARCVTGGCTRKKQSKARKHKTNNKKTQTENTV